MQTIERVLSTCDPDEAISHLYHAVYMVAETIVMPIAQKRDPDRTGGWFAFWRRDPAHTVVVVPVIGFAVGYVLPDRFVRYQYFADEKAARLAQHPEHVSSWQSRDVSPPNKMDHKYGGAIRVSPELIFSFSGFSEHEDEMLCAIAAWHINLLNVTELGQIAATSGNVPLRNRLGSPA